MAGRQSDTENDCVDKEEWRKLYDDDDDNNDVFVDNFTDVNSMLIDVERSAVNNTFTTSNNCRPTYHTIPHKHDCRGCLAADSRRPDSQQQIMVEENGLQLVSVLLFRGLSVCLSATFVHCIVLKQQCRRYQKRFPLHTAAPCLSQIALKFCLHRSTPSSPNFAPV